MKQDMLSIGGEVAISRDAIKNKNGNTDALLMGTESQFKQFAKKLDRHHHGLRKIVREISSLLDNLAIKTRIMKFGKYDIQLGKKTTIMGILNVTPDSFSNGGKYRSLDLAFERALKMVEEGVDIIDVGGESTRPGANPVPIEKELKRVIPVIKKIEKEIDVPISIDTSKATVAKEALDVGAEMVNDITALREERMAEVAADYDAPICLMHMQGDPKNMQKEPFYEDVVGEIISFLRERIDYALSKGIKKDKIIIDPGIGFGKRTGCGIEDNCAIICHLGEFKSLGFPIMISASRKRFIGNVCADEQQLPVSDRLEGSIAASALAVANGADIVRTHDVKETKRAIKMADAIVR
jgi:dihydropteroate synthase